MTVEPEKQSAALSVLRAGRPVDDLGVQLEAAQQGDGSAALLRMRRARDGLAARLRVGAPPQQALADWSCQTSLDIGALEGGATMALTLAKIPEEDGLVALSYLFADALLNSDPKWRAQADAWDAYFAKPSESETTLCMAGIDQAYAELTSLAKTAAQAQLETALARAGRQAQGRAQGQAAHVARSREAVLAAALLDLARTDELETGG